MLIVAVSPHLDDAVFSAGGTIAALTAAGSEVRVVTCFTASVARPGGFALSTQLDKNLPPDADYMALRRAEDEAALDLLGARPVHLPLPEAPHRGYHCADELFAGVHPDDAAAYALPPLLHPVLAGADLVLAPLAVGNHADHVLVADAVARLGRRTWWWRDCPYVLRAPAAPVRATVPPGRRRLIDIGPTLRRKTAAAARYRTQVPFQFGSVERMTADLRHLAATDARGHGYGEAFRYTG